MKPWRRPEEDKMTPEAHAAILARDKVCFLYRMDLRHVCRDRWGSIHEPDDRRQLTVDHVKDAPMMGKRGKRGIAMCGWGNFMGPSRLVRWAEREWLDSFEEVAA
jgi:hypothetical protein